MISLFHNRYFALPVDQAMLSNYSVYVRNPIDLSTIRARLGNRLLDYVYEYAHIHTSFFYPKIYVKHAVDFSRLNSVSVWHIHLLLHTSITQQLSILTFFILHEEHCHYLVSYKRSKPSSLSPLRIFFFIVSSTPQPSLMHSFLLILSILFIFDIHSHNISYLQRGTSLVPAKRSPQQPHRSQYLTP